MNTITLQGYHPRHKTFADYILNITREIWEERAIWEVYETYADELPLKLGSKEGISSVEDVILGTIKTLHIFPDRTMGGEAVIWDVQPDPDFHFSSHRIISTATHAGGTLYGTPTHKKIYFRTIADCLVSRNRIREEWLVRDNLFILDQLDIDIASFIEKNNPYINALPAYLNNSDLHVLEKKGMNEASKEIISTLLVDIWRNGEFQKASTLYSEESQLFTLRGLEIKGIKGIGEHIKQMSCSIDDTEVMIEQVTVNHEPEQQEVEEIAVRWIISGNYADSPDQFFTPPGHENFIEKKVVISAVSHLYITNEKIIKEYTLIDGQDVYAQLYAQL